MRRSRTVLVLSMAVLLVTAMVADGICGPPDTGQGGRRPGPGQAPGPMNGAPSGGTGGDGSVQSSGLTVTPGGGTGNTDGTATGATVLLKMLGAPKYSYTQNYRAEYVVSIPRTNSGVKIVGDFFYNSSKASGVYNGGNLTSYTPPGGGLTSWSFVDRRLMNHTLDVSLTSTVVSLQAQLDYAPLSFSKSLKAGPSVGVQRVVLKDEVTDQTMASLSESDKHQATLLTLGGWAEIALPNVFGSSLNRSGTKRPSLRFAGAGGFAKNWTAFNWEAMLSVFTMQKGSYLKESRWGQYAPALRTDIGYIGYFFNEAGRDSVPSAFIIPGIGASNNALSENTKSNISAFILRVNAVF